MHSLDADSSAAHEVALRRVVSDLRALRDALVRGAAADVEHLAGAHPSLADSALNLLHYLALRRRDLRVLQDELARLGLSSLGRSEAHVLASVDAVLATAAAAGGVALEPYEPAPVDFARGRALLVQHGEALFGPAPTLTGVRVMVTMPSAAADDPGLANVLLAAGMDCARINCAHDEPLVWRRIIDNVRNAARDQGRSCRVLMDLAGPKLRTGPLAPGPAVLKLKPRRDALGRVIAPARAWLVDSRTDLPLPDDGVTLVPVEASWLGELRRDDMLEVVDARGAVRQWRVARMSPGRCAVESDGTAYLVPGVPVRRVGPGGGPTGRIGELPATEPYLRLCVGDRLVVRRGSGRGRDAVRDAAGAVVRLAEIGCTLPAALDDVRIDEPIWFDAAASAGESRRSMRTA